MASFGGVSTIQVLFKFTFLVKSLFSVSMLLKVYCVFFGSLGTVNMYCTRYVYSSVPVPAGWVGRTGSPSTWGTTPACTQVQLSLLDS